MGVGLRQEDAIGASLDLAFLQSNTMQDEDLQRDVLSIFFGEIDGLLKRLEEASCDRVWYETSHAIKGGARGVGLKPLSELAQQSESLMGSINETRRHALHAALREEVGLAREQVRAIFPGIFD